MDLALKNTWITSWIWIWNTLGLHYWTWIDFIKHRNHYREAKQGDRYKSMNTFLYCCFLFFNIKLAFTASSFGNLCMMISPSTLLCFMLHIFQSYIYNVSPFFNVIISKRIVQIQSSSISLDQILCGVENQIIMLLSSKIEVFSVSRKSYPGSSLVQFRLKGNNKCKWVSKRVTQCCSLPVISRNTFKK